MFNRIFNPDNFFFRGCNKIFDMALLSLLWLALCLPIVTIGSSTAALYYTVVKCIRRGEPQPYRNFLMCFRENLKTGVIVTLLTGAVGLLLCVEYGMLLQVAQTGKQAAVLMYYSFYVLLLVVVGVASYLFPLLSRFTLTVGQLFIRAFQLALRHLPSTVLLALLNIEAARLALQYGYPFVLPLLYAPSVAALLSSLFLERIFKKYTPQEGGGAEDEEAPPWYLK